MSASTQNQSADVAIRLLYGTDHWCMLVSGYSDPASVPHTDSFHVVAVGVV